MFLTSSKMPYPSESKTTRCTTQYFVNFLKQSGTSKQKWNLMNKKLGNHKQGINVSEIETEGGKIVDKKAICNALNNFLRKWAFW